jgi:UDP-sugar transporter A1/2/3
MSVNGRVRKISFAGGKKWLLLTAFVLQNSSTVLVGSYTRSSSSVDDKKDLYDVHHMILCSEILKLVLSCVFEGMHTKWRLLESLQNHILYKPYDSGKVALPAVLYYCQNVLVYVALRFLSAPLFQVTYQSKLVTTALLSVLFLEQRYSMRQWACIFSLSMGVAIVIITEQQARSDNKKS